MNHSGEAALPESGAELEGIVNIEDLSLTDRIEGYISYLVGKAQQFY